MAKLDRQTFEVSRELEYFSADELAMQIGHGRDWWPVAILKELVDNALDACEVAGVAPRVDVAFEGDLLTVQDNGPGLPARTLEASLDYTKRVSDKVHYVSPTRGRIGNALKVMWAAPFVTSEDRADFDVYTPGQHHRVVVEIDRLRQEPAIAHEVEPCDEVTEGTRIVIRWPDSASYLSGEAGCDSYKQPAMTAATLIEDYAAFNPHAEFTVNGQVYEPTDAEWKKWSPQDPTSAHWYTAPELRDLIAAYIVTPEYAASPKTVRAFVAEFKGLSSTAKQKIVTEGLAGCYLADLVTDGDIDMATVGLLLARMQAHSKAPTAKMLGKIGKEHLSRWLVEYAGAVEGSVKYLVSYGNGPMADVVEIGFGVFEETRRRRRIVSGLNWSAMLKTPFAEVDRVLGGQRIDPHDPVVLVVHFARPQVNFTDRGKTRVAL